MANLLDNPGFEQDWGDEESHWALVIPAEGESYHAEFGNIFTPPGWTTWFYHDGEKWAQPEVRDAWKKHDGRRVHGGEKATLLFTFGRKHDAGFYQQVRVAPGSRLRLTAWAHAWSNHKGNSEDFPHPDDAKWSEGAGYEVVAWEEGTWTGNTDDPQEDAKPNFTFQVGIDPTGGTDPFAYTVRWGQGWHIYNGYCQQLEVEATAKADTVTVFLRSDTMWAFKHNDAYWDDVELVAVGTGDGRGAPRAQYERTYNVIPAGATEEQAAAVFIEGWRRSRETAGGSYDDAGIGDLDVRIANLYGIPEEDRPDFIGFYDKHYPGVEVVFKDIPGGEPEPEPETNNPQMTPSIGPHCQTWVGGVWEYLAAARPRVAKVFWLEAVDEIKAQSPDTDVIVRIFADGYDDVFGALRSEGRLAAGRVWVNKARDSIIATAQRMAAAFPDRPDCARFYFEGPNEIYPSQNAEAVCEAADIDVGVCLALAELGVNVGPAVFCAAVGNPHESEYELLVELGQVCEAHGGLFGYHSYFPVNHGDGGPDTLWPHLAGRWTKIDEVLIANGIHVRWYGGESGAVGGEWNGGVWLNYLAGWRDMSCYGGDWGPYREAIMQMDELNRQWNADHGGRKLGDVLFTSAQACGWENFLIKQEQWDSLREAMLERYDL